VILSLRNQVCGGGGGTCSERPPPIGIVVVVVVMVVVMVVVRVTVWFNIPTYSTGEKQS